jgi:hypothetical protein
MTERNFIRVKLDVVLEVPGKGIEPLVNVSITDSLLEGLLARDVDVRQASIGTRKLEWVDERGRRRGAR